MTTHRDPFKVAYCRALSSSAGVSIACRVRRYVVVGSSWERIGRAIEALGPRVRGRAQAAATRWEIGWRHGVDVTAAGRFAASDVAATLSIDVVLPDWRTSGEAPRSLVARWDEYIQRLERHERHHAEIAADGVRKLKSALEATPPKVTEPALRLEVAARAHDALRAIARRDAEFDSATAHGTRDMRNEVV